MENKSSSVRKKSQTLAWPRSTSSRKRATEHPRCYSLLPMAAAAAVMAGAGVIAGAGGGGCAAHVGCGGGCSHGCGCHGCGGCRHGCSGCGCVSFFFGGCGGCGGCGGGYWCWINGVQYWCPYGYGY